ncbi:MAG: HAMP domain-containing histidine kinase [Clostridia bacterium]|nr:HAMP domain-containing histidine kinase [Clostridia bacterium]
MICIIIFPEIIFTSFTNMILPLYGIEGIYKYDPYVLAVTFSLFAFFAIRYNVMGTKLIIRLEHQHYKNARQSLSSGTAILNHAIKNELIKISLCTENMMSTDSFKKENGKAILESVDYLLDFTARIQDKLSDKALVEKKCSFEQLVTKPLEMLQPILRQKNISVNLNLGSNIDLYCDELHIHEVIKNIVTNSAEAMAANEKIDIKTYFNKNHFTISIMDTGKGIPKEYLSRVIEPFFTTKKSSLNFGLGLSYCYNIMHQHGGALEIFSKENSGTTVLLIFPISRVSKLYYIDKNRRLA